jgi:hypothetical protein
MEIDGEVFGVKDGVKKVKGNDMIVEDQKTFVNEAVPVDRSCETQ